MSSGVQRRVQGSFLGTGANLDITKVGFRPTKVVLINRGGLATAEWNSEMPDASAAKRVTAGTLSFVTSGGVTPLANGFRLGTDADMNVSGELVYFEAFE